MGLSKVIEDAIEQEVESRLQEKLDSILGMISKNYNIKLDRLLKDLSTIKTSETTPHTCCGQLKNGTKCKSKAKDGTGYCKRHIEQKPKPVKVFEEPDTQSTASNPFFQGLSQQLRKPDPT
jgi:hypothetical protein